MKYCGRLNWSIKRRTNKFIGYAIRSLAEVVTCLHKAIRRKYCNENTFNKYYLDAYELMNMMIAFRKNLN